MVVVLPNHLPLDRLSTTSVSNKPKASTCFPTTMIPPVIDLSSPDCRTELVKACEEYGFFKVINHGVPLDLISTLFDETVNFFSLPLSEKEKAGPADPFGYGNRRIGRTGDVGWIEYLLLNLQPPPHPESIYQKSFCVALNEYTRVMRSLACRVLELVADGLKITPRDAFSHFLEDEKSSDSVFRLNHYPPCPKFTNLSCSNPVGFGEHTDPQIITVLRSNNTAGLEICLRDGTWVNVPPDQSSFFINVGDALQVLTNGRFRSVRHRVIANNVKSRISMIFFGGPPLTAKVAPLPYFLKGDKCRYKEFTWCEYKRAAYTSRLADNRLDSFTLKEDKDDKDIL